MSTFSEDSLLAVRFGNARTGFDLVGIVDAALPVARITVEALAQDSKDIPLLEEYVLRLVEGGARTPESMAGFLGLDLAMVNQTVAVLFGSDDLRWVAPVPGTPPVPRLRLTEKGRFTATKAAAIVPVRISQSLVFDQMLWRASPYSRRSTIARNVATEAGMIMLPAARSGPVEDGEVTADEITTLLQENGNTTREVLQIKSIVQARTRHVLPVKLLVYADAERIDIELGVVIDGELSDRHEIELIGFGGAKGLGINVEPEPERPLLDPDLEEARVPLQEVTQKRAEQAAVQLNAPAPLPSEPEAQKLQAEEIRAIGVFEHPELLDEALTSARKRILIISPWITGAILTTAFIGKLERRLQRGVKVDIAYGYDDSENRTDPNAIKRLNNLAARYPEKLHVARLKSNHAKILLFDDTWVTTSFNWLSFKGDPDRTYRVEEGTLIRNRGKSDTYYTRYLELIDDNRR
ncbi:MULTISPECIES: phospholipase D-like domain-containing protein [Streptomyces]|uniref:phospholipase D-like domain-containing protein n=1 Tax=Streptomyces TaxID=1883 RepID=UPI001FADF43D|nr:phospholipase D-like domain-containing protein [Streptomyces sp. PBSH9]